LIGACGHIDEEKDDFYYMIGLLADENTNTEGFSVIHAPAAAWAVFRSPEFDSRPDGAEIPKLFQSAYKEWLPTAGYDKMEGREGEIYDMEIYGVTDSGKYFEEVWLSVVKR
jgi:AraC family transcriptional regulator